MNSRRIVQDFLLAGARPHPLNHEYSCLELSLLEANSDDDNNHADGRRSTGTVGGGATIACVGLNRPHRRNALDRDMWTEIGRFFSSTVVESFPPCRAVLLYGIGRDFCSGIDVKDRRFPFPECTQESTTKDPARMGLAFLPALKQMQDSFTALEGCMVPVVAAVHGNCVGAGVDLVCSADVVWCTCDATFAIREVVLGLTADVGTLQRLPKRSGNHSLVRELCLTGRDFGPLEAEAMGLVGQVCRSREALMEEAVALCRQIALHSPVAVHGTKRALLHARDHSVEDGLKDVAQYNSLALQSPDARTAMVSALSRKTGAFADLLIASKL